MKTLKGFLKELKKEYGPTPSEQSLADFIYNNYEKVTGEKLEDSDPAANNHIADIIAHFKMDGEDFMIAWEDRTNESVVNEASKDRMIKQIERALKNGDSIFKLPIDTQTYYRKNKSDFETIEEGKVKVFLDKILRKMVDGGLGNAYNPKMRAELRDKIEQVVKETMEKYDYIVESKEDIFLDYNEIVGYEFKKFKESYLKLHKDNTIIEDGDILYGVRKGSNEPHWKYFEEDGKLMHSEKNRDVLGLINFFNQVKRNHPWSK
jgi:hypothetical protein